MICTNITSKFVQNHAVEFKFAGDGDLTITTEFNLHLANRIVSLFYNSHDQSRLDHQINHTDNYKYSDFRTIIRCVVSSHDRTYDQCSGGFVISLRNYKYVISCNYCKDHKFEVVNMTLTIDQLIDIVQVCCQLLIASNNYFCECIDAMRLQMNSTTKSLYMA